MKNNRMDSRMSPFALALGLLVPFQVAAQTGPAGDAATAAQSADTELDVVYVSARKRDETRLEVPVSVSAFSQSGLDERGITNTADLSALVPGFDYEPTGTGGFGGRSSPQIRFRGIGAQVATAASRAGAFFWDGAYVSDGIGVVPLVDLGQVEVIKGPQTAFFGRNTFAGAVNYIPAAPTEEFEARLAGSLTNTDVDDGYSLTAVLSGPISTNLSGRVAVSVEKRAAHWEFQDGLPLGEEDNNAIFASLNYKLGEATELKYSGYYVDSEDTSSQGGFNATFPTGTCNRSFDGNLVNVVTGASEGPFSTNLATAFGTFCGTIPDFSTSTFTAPLIGGVPSPTDPRVGLNGTFTYATASTLPSQFGSFIDAPAGLGNTYGVWRHHLSADTELNNGFSVAGFVSFGESQNWALFDNQFGSLTTVRYTGFVQESNDVSAEIRLVSPAERRLRFMVGASYYDLENNVVEIRNGNYAGVTAADPFATLVESDVLGIFGSVDYDITDELTVSAEGRWQDDTQTLVYLGPSARNLVTNPATIVTNQEQTYKEFMPRVILTYQPAGKNLNLYGSYSESFLQGTQTNADGYGAAVPGSGISSASVGFFTPVQQLKALELGIKQDVNEMFQYSVALYRMDWENQVQFVLSPTFVAYYQPGNSEYQGLELEGTLKLNEWVTLSAGYNYVDAELTQYAEVGTLAFRLLALGLVDSDTAVDASGNRPRYIPTHSGNVSADFNFGKFSVRADASYFGDFFIDNLEYNQVDAAWKVNLRAGYEFNDSVRAEAFANNVFDDLSPSPSGGTTGFFSRRYFGTPVRGTEIGLRLTAKF